MAFKSSIIFLRTLLYVLSISAIVLSCLAVIDCDFVSYTLPATNQTSFESTSSTTTTFHAGFYQVQLPISDNPLSSLSFLLRENSACTSFSNLNYNFSSVEQIARVCALLAPMFGFIALILLLLQRLCFGIHFFSCIQIFIVLSFFAAWICQGLTFLWYDSQFCFLPTTLAKNRDINPWSIISSSSSDQLYTCSMGLGSIFSIVAFACYFINSFFICSLSNPDTFVFKISSLQEHPTEQGEEEGVSTWKQSRKSSSRNNKKSQLVVPQEIKGQASPKTSVVTGLESPI